MGVLFCLSVVLVSVLLVEFLLVLLGCCSCKSVVVEVLLLVFGVVVVGMLLLGVRCICCWGCFCCYRCF